MSKKSISFRTYLALQVIVGEEAAAYFAAVDSAREQLQSLEGLTSAEADAFLVKYLKRLSDSLDIAKRVMREHPDLDPVQLAELSFMEVKKSGLNVPDLEVPEVK